MVSNPASPVAAGGAGRDVGTGVDWEYAPAPESRDIVSIQSEYGLFLGGEFVAPQSGEHFATINPASEEPLASVAQAGQRDVDRAVASAREAYERSWGSMPGRERAKYLYRLGASSLLNDVLMQLRKEKTGAYQSPDYFTVD